MHLFLVNIYKNFHFFSDPFADASKGDDLLPAGTEDYIHIRIQQRNGRKTLTTVQGIADDYDKKKLVKAFKKVFVKLLIPSNCFTLGKCLELNS